MGRRCTRDLVASGVTDGVNTTMFGPLLREAVDVAAVRSTKFD